MTLATIETAASPEGLFVMGVAPAERGARVLLGADTGLWPRFCASPEINDGAPDPLDRWSKRVIGAIAQTVGGVAQYPSDGPPYLPFIQWALDSGRFWQSPTGMLVHDVAGLMISMRGAIHLPRLRAEPPRAPSPCKSCADQPCAKACPVGALSSATAYNVKACKSHIAAPAGASCMSAGCLTRRACPISQNFGRDPAQSAFHMRAFLAG